MIDKEMLVSLTTEIVAAHVENNSVAINDLPKLIRNVHDALAGLDAPAPEPEAIQDPAVSIRSSVKPDYIVCLECGSKNKMLKRHLATGHKMSPADYRQKWNLPAEYPIVAPNYAEQRRTLAKAIGLGTKPRQKRATPKTK